MGSQLPAEPQDPTGAVLHLPPACPRQASHVGQWVEASEPCREVPASPIAAVEEAPLHYAGSIASTAGSRQGFANNFKKLKKPIASLQSTEAMGEKTIAYKLKEMSASADKVRAKLDAGEELEAGLMAEIEEALDTADLLGKGAVI